MNKVSLAEFIAKKHNTTPTAALEAIDAVLDAIFRNTITEGYVTITGFGSFRLHQMNDRMGRNPQTGAQVPIAATKVVKFRPGARFNEVAGDPEKLEDLGFYSAGKFPKGAKQA